MNTHARGIRPIWRVLTAILFLAAVNCLSAVSLTDLRCEYRVNPLGIDNTQPRLSWKLIDASTRGQQQTAYQVLVASTEAQLEQDIGDLWDSEMIEESESVNNLYAGAPLQSGQECYWKVRVRDSEGKLSEWSPHAKFTVGLLNSEDWTGEWIMKEDQLKTDHNWYRKNFTLSANASSAYVYLASFGYHELYVNGEKVSENVMNPVSSFMKTRIPYLTYDISEYLFEGDNVIAVWHAAGWARWKRVREYRNVPFVFKAQTEIMVGNERMSFGSDTSWRCKKSHSQYYGDWNVLHFGGETIDDRLKEDDWNTAAYDDSNWMRASVYDAATLNAKLPKVENVGVAQPGKKAPPAPAKYPEINAELSAQMVEPQVRFKEIQAIAIRDNKDGTYRIDMGENFTGFFEMDLYQGTAGDAVFFEIADQEGQTSSWKQKSQYIYGDSGQGRFENRFNLAGGRWITVSGLKYMPELKDVKGYVITNNRKQISAFESSNELLNKIYKINLDTYLANTIDGILVDCPHRERRGWGEVTVAAMYGDALPNFESGAYMEQYLQYQRDAQLRDGQIRAVINEADRPFLMWKANSPITVWETYKMTGDQKILRDNYASMTKWMDWLFKHSNYSIGGALIIGEQGKREMPGLGDWCTPRGNFWSSSNSPSAVHFNNCVYAYMLDCAMKTAKALGETKDAETYADRLKVQREATHRQTYDPATGKYLDGKQVDQAFALLAGVTPEAERSKVSAQLADNVLYTFPYYDTGSSGQALYTRYFAEYGERMDLVYELLQDTAHPSYGYFIEQGKTVWPERWSAIGNSQIHTCYTGIGAYFIKGFGGIRPDLERPGMRHFLIKPAPVGDLTYADTEFESSYGSIVSNWKRSGGSASFHIKVPVNTWAKVYIPAVGKEHVREGGQLAEQAEGVSYLGSEQSAAVGNYVIYGVGSGVYNFSVSAVPEVSYPEPISTPENLSMLARMSASSMYIETEKIPGFEAFKSNDANSETLWRAASTRAQWLEAAWVKPQTFNSVQINEVGGHITSHRLQVWKEGAWHDVAAGEACGAARVYTFELVTASKCRLLITSASQAPEIAEIIIRELNHSVSDSFGAK